MFACVAGATLEEQLYSEQFCSAILSAVLFYLAWSRSGLADFDEIWHAEPP